MKHCSRCDKEKPSLEFHKRSRSKDGLQPVCKECLKPNFSNVSLECLVCSSHFNPTNGRQKYCSAKCRAIRDYRQYKSKPRVIERNKLYQTKRYKNFDGYLDRLIGRARRNTPDTDIDRGFLKELLENSNYSCPISGLKYSCINSYNCSINPLAPSLDQINPGKGYYKNNVQLISVIMNRAKNDMPNEDFINMMKQISENLK